MSAQPCGCDKEAAWMCERHLEEALSMTNERAPMKDATHTLTSNTQRFLDRLANEQTMRDTIDTPAVRIVTAAVDLLAERHRIAQVLATFYRAELSMSSVQPLLALAVELNPDLVERAR